MPWKHCGNSAERAFRRIRPQRLRHLEASTASATALVPHIGYENAAELAKKALLEATTIRALAEKLLPGIDLDKLLNPETLAGIRPKHRT